MEKNKTFWEISKKLLIALNDNEYHYVILKLSNTNIPKEDGYIMKCEVKPELQNLPDIEKELKDELENLLFKFYFEDSELSDLTNNRVFEFFVIGNNEISIKSYDMSFGIRN